MNSWRNLVPAPLAAPETRTLKAARLRTMTGLFLAICLVIVWWIFKTGYRLKN